MTQLPNRIAEIAMLVDRYLRRRKVASPGPLALRRVFDVLFYASLKTEEQKPLTFAVNYLDPARPDPKPPRRIREHRWGYFRLEQPIPFSVSNLAKIAGAMDPEAASLAIHVDTQQRPFIWGIIDQLPLHYSRFVTWEADSGPEVPGLFQATVTGIGEISVYRAYDLIVSLRQELITRDYHRVLWSGPVHSQLNHYIRSYLSSVCTALRRKPKNLDGWERHYANIWLASLCRVLIRMKEYRHGGAILIQPRFSSSGLKMNYPVHYTKLGDSLVKHAVQLSLFLEAWADRIHHVSKAGSRVPVPEEVYLSSITSRNEKNDCQAALAGSVGLIASLSRVDGLVLLDSKLAVRGFGVEITEKYELNSVYVARTAIGSPKSLRRRDTKLFGTRHRSMMRYCASHPGSIGFVVSQDGPVRAIMKVGNKVVMWEDIQLRLAFEIAEYKSRRAKPKSGQQTVMLL
jgi:hypothetical protein